MKIHRVGQQVPSSHILVLPSPSPLVVQQLLPPSPGSPQVKIGLQTIITVFCAALPSACDRNV